MKLDRLVLASLLTLPLAACLDEGESSDDVEELATTESELCTDGAADRTVVFRDHDGFSGGTSLGPSSNYDRPACADRYSVEITGVGAATQDFYVQGGWGESLPLTAEACPFALAKVQTQEYKLTGFNCSGSFCIPQYGWVNVGGDITLGGVWKETIWGNHECQLVPESPLPTFQPNAFRSKVRVSVSALVWAVFFPAYKKATAGVYSNYIIY